MSTTHYVLQLLHQINLSSMEKCINKYEQYWFLSNVSQHLSKTFNTKFYVKHGYLVKNNIVVDCIHYVYHPQIPTYDFYYKDNMYFFTKINKYCDTLDISEPVIKQSILAIL